MPGGDRTGPMGAGPRSGRAAGFCAGYATPGYMNPYGWYGGGGGFARGRAGRGFGRGPGRGRGWGYRFGPDRGIAYGYGVAPGDVAEPPFQADELEMLKEQQRQLQAALDGIGRRINQLEKEGD